MHDHANNKCLAILKNIVKAMTNASTLLVDEIVVPNKNIDWYVTQTDLAMMVQFSAMGRTKSHWHRLLTEAGLKIQSVTTYTHAFQLSIVAATK
jgi:demethylsterigmatocystin 6-O-methyltransferase